MVVQELIQLRRELHRRPERSGEEERTAARIRAFLTAHAPDLLWDKVGGHGLVAIYNFGNPGPSVLIRCELDALPIDEPNTFAHRSETKGIAHKCGHDGHMTIVAGLAPWLSEQAFRHGKVILLFQPAEETGRGAKAILEDARFGELSPDYVFALHNIPGYPLHEVIMVDRQFSATVKSVAIRLEGVQSHAAEPERGNNPAWAMAEITRELKHWNVPDPKRRDFTLVTPVCTRMGQRDYGISAGRGELHFTLRCWEVVQMEDLILQLEETVSRIADSYTLTHELEYFDYFPATANAAAANEWIARAAQSAGLTITSKSHPFKFGEDFGWLSQRYAGAMFGLGAGLDTPPLHHATYDFPEELIGSGLAMFKEIIQAILSA